VAAMHPGGSAAVFLRARQGTVESEEVRGFPG
jgi:hypothetical protein